MSWSLRNLIDRRGVSCALGLVMLVAGCSSDPQSARQLIGKDGVRTLQEPQHVEVFRVRSVAALAATANPDDAQIDQWIVVKVDSGNQALAKQIADVLLADDTYMFGPGAKACIFDPAVVLRVWSGADAIDALVCFHCNEIELLTRDGAGRIVHRAYEDLNPSRAALVRLVKRLIPNDREIQAVAERFRG